MRLMGREIRYRHFGPTGCPKMSVTNYQSTLQEKLQMKQLTLIHPLWCLNIYHLTHTHYCTLIRATNSFQPNFPIVSHRIILYIHLHRLVHLGSQTKILLCKAWCPICANWPQTGEFSAVKLKSL